MERKNLLQFKKERNVKSKKVQCPCCTNGRLMDMVSAEKAELEIKCPICKKTIHISLEHNEIFASAI
jgi:ribosomal protein S27E